MKQGTMKAETGWGTARGSADWQSAVSAGWQPAGLESEPSASENVGHSRLPTCETAGCQPALRASVAGPASRLGWAVSALVAAVLPAHAALVTEPTQTWSVGYTVSDDGNTAGPFGITVGGSAIQAITRVEVGLSFSGVGLDGGFAGDLVVTLAWTPVGDGPLDIVTSHLLNRIGVGTVDGGSTGFGYDSLNVTLSNDAAGGDIHTASLVSATLTGSFEPDGRSVGSGSARDFRLNVFNGQPADGSWQLYVTDMVSGGQMRLDSWSLSLTGDTQVPEASTWAAGAALLGLVAWQRWRR